MTIKEIEIQLAAKQNELISLKEGSENGDVEAIEKAGEIDVAIAKLNEELASIQESAVKAQAIVAAIGTPTEEPMEEGNMEGLKSLNLEYLKSNRGAVSAEVKAAVNGPTITEISQKVVDAQPKLGVRDLFAQETMSGNSLTYFVMGATTGTPAATAQGAAKANVAPSYTPVTEALAKIACHIKETDELLSDAPYLESVVRGRGVYETNLAIEAYIVSKLVGTSGLSTLTGMTLDNVLKAKMGILEDTGYEADAIIINPADLETFMTQKDQNGQYLFGGPAYAPYGNGAFNSYPTIWGLKIVPSSKITAGTAVVGAFAQGGSVVSKANEGFRVEVTNSDQDDFIKNMITVRIEERLLAAIRVPSAFCKISTT